MGVGINQYRNCTDLGRGGQARRPAQFRPWPGWPRRAHPGQNARLPALRNQGKRQMPRKIVARRSAIHGNGVFAAAPIATGERIVEYKGQRRTHAEVDADDSGDVESGHTFLFTLNDEYVIDGDRQGGVARWINHGCAPNCEAVLVEHEGEDRRRDRVFIEAIRDIAAGEELTYNYGITLAEPHTARLKKVWACRCGAPGCTGTMLQPKRKPRA